MQLFFFIRFTNRKLANSYEIPTKNTPPIKQKIQVINFDIDSDDMLYKKYLIKKKSI